MFAIARISFATFLIYSAYYNSIRAFQTTNLYRIDLKLISRDLCFRFDFEDKQINHLIADKAKIVDCDRWFDQSTMRIDFAWLRMIFAISRHCEAICRVEILCEICFCLLSNRESVRKYDFSIYKVDTFVCKTIKILSEDFK